MRAGVGRMQRHARLLPGSPAGRARQRPLVGVTWASPDFFDALGIRLVRGRWFTDRDRQGQPKVVVINETAAQQFWPGDNPIGKRIGLGQGGFRDGAEVIGVAADVRYRRGRDAARARRLHSGAAVAAPARHVLRAQPLRRVRARADRSGRSSPRSIAICR